MLSPVVSSISLGESEPADTTVPIRGIISVPTEQDNTSPAFRVTTENVAVPADVELPPFWLSRFSKSSVNSSAYAYN